MDNALPIIPRVHMNGTSRQGLIDQQLGIMDAASKLLDALRNAAPNGRDYYPLGPNALTQAQAEHRRRAEAIEAIHSEAEQIALRIQESC